MNFTQVLPISSEFEESSFVESTKTSKYIKFIDWFEQTSGFHTFKALSHVIAIDMSGIGLMELPHEIEMCESLEFLDLSNNNLTYLPPELSRCNRLKTLIIKGNFNLEYVSSIQALSELRLYCDMDLSPPSIHYSTNNGMFSVMTWNITSQYKCTQRAFPHSLCDDLQWSSRLSSIIMTVLDAKPSILCLQEVDPDNFQLLNDRMKLNGYVSVASYPSRARDSQPLEGVATFYLKQRVKLEQNIRVCFSDLGDLDDATRLEFMSNDSVYQLSMFRVQGQIVIVVNCLFHHTPYEEEIVKKQISIMLDKLSGINEQILIMGSFDSEPGSDEYNMMSAYKSVYNEVESEPEFTYISDDKMKTTDFIWATRYLTPTGIILLPGKKDAKKYFEVVPNKNWPSVHMPLGSLLDFKAQMIY